MIAKRRTVVISLAVGGALALPAPANACSRIGYHATRSPTTAHFIATPRADTVFAGAGSVKYVVMPGHSGPARERAVYGQLVSIERIGGLAAQGLRQPVQQVVLVPWDYGADCTPTPWSRSAAWAQVGSRGLFTAVLRDSAHWAGGIPTFDVFAPEFEPYPQQNLRQRRRASADSVVPMEELFELLELFPDERLLPDSGEAAVAALFAWARANPTLTRRYPVADVLRRAVYIVGMQRMRAIRSPLTGTWKLTVTLSGDTARTFYARTGRVPSSLWYSGRAQPPAPDDPTFVPRADGYHLQTAVAHSLDALPDRCENKDGRREAYMAIADSALAARPDARAWTGSLEANLAARAFPEIPALDQFARADFNAYYQRSVAKLPVLTPARFAQSADGTITVEQVLTLDDGRSLIYSGTRVSPDVVACRW